MEIVEIMRQQKSIDAVAQAFDALDHQGRLQEMYRFTHDDQAQLFELAAGRPCKLEGDFVRPGEPLKEVIHWGINSLPVFRKFQKRFCWPATGHAPRVAVGYNEQLMKTFTGPGFFTAREAVMPDRPGGRNLPTGPTVVIDYTLLPTERAPTWPGILPNTARLSRFVYNGTQDWMWKVSKNVSIGRASRGSGWMPNWFILCRED